jgi:phytoene dehydrogenase-like protein
MGMETAIVIGGGPAGLVAANHLAQAGVATTLLEAKAKLGGRASTERQDGFDLNQGPHALYVGSCAMRELKGFGIDPPRWNPVSVTKSFVVRDGEAIRPVRGWGAAGKLMRHEPEPGQTANEWLDEHLDDPRSRDLGAALLRVTTFVADHDALPADVAFAQLKLGAWPGVRYLKGGWQWMVDALATGAEHRGATVRTRSAVRGLERSGDRWTVATDDQQLTADAVIVAAGLPSAFAKLIDGVEAPGPAADVSVLDLGLDRIPTGRSFALGADEPTYISKHSPPKHPHGILMSAMSYAGTPEADLERLADIVLGDWRGELITRRHLPKMTAISAVASPAKRPPVEREPGLFVAGDWVGAEGWLSDAAFASGSAAAKAALAQRTPVAA